MPTVPWSIGRDLIARRAGPLPARRSLYACAALAIGYALAAFVAPGITSTYWLAAAPALLIGAVLLKGWPCRLALCACVVALGAGWYAARINERARSSVAWGVDEESLGGEPMLATVRGVIRDIPRTLEPARGILGRFARADQSGGGVGFTLALSGIETNQGAQTVPTSGDIRVRVEGELATLSKSLHPGASVRLTGRLRPVKGPSNPGEPDWLALAAQEGRVGDMDIPSADLITLREPEGWRESTRAWWCQTIGVLHARCVRALDGATPTNKQDSEKARSRALLGAILLGERSASLDEVNAAFTRLGLVHLVAISGFNLAVMAGFVMFGLRLTGDRGWLEPLLLALLVALYMLILPAQAPILRAGVLVLVLLLADALGRRYDRAALLGWIALILLIVRPLDAWSLGFQLSFGIVAALLILGNTVHHRIWGVPIRGLSPVHQPHGRMGALGWFPIAASALSSWFVKFFKAQISASILAWGVSIPIVACHTGQIGLLTPLLTLVVLPLTVIVLWAGYLTLLVGLIIPPASGLITGTLDQLASFLVHVIMWLDQLPGASIQLPQVSAWWAIACVAGVVYLVHRGTLRDRWTWAVVAALAAWLGAEFQFGTRLSRTTVMRLDTLAVGDGSCHLIRHRGEAALWDCGSLNTGIGERLVPQALRELGVWRIPTVVVTHAHIDHFAALPDIAEQIGLKRVYVPPQLTKFAAANPSSAPAALLAELAKHNVQVLNLSTGDTVELAGLHATILWPPRDGEFRDTNDSSLVAMLEVPAAGASRRVLLTGDAAKEALSSLLPDSSHAPDAASALSLRADILELPHHGAYIEQAVALVSTVNPSVVLQSTGPRRASEQRWSQPLAGRAWYATPRQGAAWVEVRSDGSIISGSYR